MRISDGEGYSFKLTDIVLPLGEIRQYLKLRFTKKVGFPRDLSLLNNNAATVHFHLTMKGVLPFFHCG